MNSAAIGKFDKQGRVNISQNTLYADQEKNCRITGNNDRIEIWNEDRWQEYIAETEENF